MQIKLTGEQPFQVLSTSFSIGPSTSGYDLYFSADGVNYTQLFTVGAGVNRQVTQVAAGSYYKLVGNTGNVVVNWYGNCVVDNGGGGGGSYVLPVASSDTLGGVKIGSGITIDSGGTISAQGGGGNNPRVILLNNLSQQELVDLYDEITAMYDYQNMAFTSEFNASDYEFYIDLTDSSKRAGVGVGDRNFEGWFPVILNYVNPNDYDGGAIYFTGVEGRQDGNGYLFNIRYIVNNQGNTEASCWTIEPPQPDYQHAIQITSGGTFENPDGLGIFASENFNHKVMFVWREGNDQPGWGQAPLKYVWRKLDQDNHLVYHFAVENIPIDGVLYKGTWHVTENDWGNYTTDTWTTV